VFTGGHMAICLRIVRALNMIIDNIHISSVAKSQAISPKPGAISITAHNASLAYFR
jgi:hypothetical protein